MVSTRNHPREFSAPKSPSVHSSPAATPSPSQPSSKESSRTSGTRWAHTPSILTLVWLCISLPLVSWDTLYVFLRPHSMPGGRLQWPIFTPYELYGQVDYIYGWPSYNSHNGFTAAQSSLNIVETAGYIYYLYLIFTHGKTEAFQGTGAPPKKYLGKLSQSRTIQGRYAALSLVVLYGVALMTLSKTVLYWLNEAFSGFSNIGHNDVSSLVFLWIIPNGAWIALPLYVTYVSGKEIIEGLEVAAEGSKKIQ